MGISAGTSSRRLGRAAALLTAIAMAMFVVPAPASAEPVELTISGTVAGSLGETLVEASVELYTDDPGGAVQSVPVVDGSFSIDITESGEYRLFASAPGFTGSWWQGVGSYYDATPVSVTDADVAGIDFVIDAVQPPPTVLGVVTGGVPAVPLEGVTVEVVDPDGWSAPTAITDSEGQFEITDLPATGWVRFHPTGDFAGQWFDKVSSQNRATKLDFSESHIINAELTVAGTVSGRILGALKPGAEALPLSGSSAALYEADGSFVEEVGADDNGVFSFSGVAAGTYRLGFGSPSPRWKRTYLGRVDRISLSHTFTVAAGQGVNVGDAVLMRASSISGTIIDRVSGNPLEQSVMVSLYSLSGERLSNEWAYDGTYEFSDVPSGSYLVKVWGSSGRSTGWYGGTVSFASATPVVVGRGTVSSGINLTVVPSGSVSGDFDARGYDNAFVDVEVYTPGGQLVAVYPSANQGSFYIGGIKPGTYLVYFRTDVELLTGEWWGNTSRRTSAHRVTVVAGETTEINGTVLPLVAGGAISGHMNSDSYVDAKIYGPGIDREMARNIPVYDDGSFLTSGLRPGKFTVVFNDTIARSVTVVAGKTTVMPTVTITSVGTTQVDATVTAGGEPVGAMVEFFTLGGKLTASEFVSAESPQSVYIERGQYKVRFRAATPNSTLGGSWLGGKSSFATSETLDIGEEPVSVSGSLVADSSFSARITDSATGKVLSGVDVVPFELEPNGSWVNRAQLRATTDAYGRFVASGLSRGTYRFIAEDPDGNHSTAWFGGSTLTSADNVVISSINQTRSTTTAIALPPLLGIIAVKTPTIAGTMDVGRTLTAKTGFVWPSKSVTLKYRWYRDGTAISGATGVTYKLTSADRGKEITVRVSGSRQFYTSSSSRSLPRNTLD